MPRTFTIGLDLGGTDLKAGLVSRKGELHAFHKRPSRASESAEAPLQAMLEAIEALRAIDSDARIVAIGVGAPGMIDPDSGSQVGATPHLPHWNSFPLRERLRRRLALPVAVDNDANLAALGESRCGAARRSRVSITVTVGTGIGAGIVLDGRVLHGSGGGAGEVGHLPLGLRPTSCACGVTSCVEPEASGSGLERRALEIGIEPPAGPGVFAGAAAGEKSAQAIVEAMADRLGAVLGTAVNLLNPDTIVLGGGVAGAGSALFDPLRRALDRYALATHRRDLRLVPAALGEAAGVVGAGLWAWESAAPRGGAARRLRRSAPARGRSRARRSRSRTA